MNFGEMLRQLMDENNISVSELARRTGINRNTLYSYLRRNTQRPDPSVLGTLSEAFGVDVSYFLGISPRSQHGYPETVSTFPFGKSIDGIISRTKLQTRRVPILGDTAAGEPIIANREYDEWVDIPDDGHHYDAAFRVTGESMAPKYHKGDLVFVRYQDDVFDGQVAVVCLDDGVTLKRVYHVSGGLSLLSDNPDFPPQNYTADDFSSAHVVGLAVGFLHWDY